MADDHPILRNSLKYFFEKTDDICVIAEAIDGIEAIDLVLKLNPDVLLLDMSLPMKDGLEVTQELKSKGSAVRIIAFSAYEDKAYIRGVLNLGASGYLIKFEPIEVVIEAIRGVACGQEGWISREVKAILMGIGDQEELFLKPLMPRERQVCRLIVRGKSNKLIGKELSLSEKTVEKYLCSIFEKLNVKTRVELAVKIAHTEEKADIHRT